jgi:hypothetical protein
MAGNGPIRILVFVVLTVSRALCQQSMKLPTTDSLPDSPLPQISAHRFEDFVKDLRVPVRQLGPANESSVLRSDFGSVNAGFALYRERFQFKAESAQAASGDPLEKYFRHPSLNQSVAYHPSTSDGFMGRATHAATSILISRDEEGRARLNTPYLLSVLTSAAAHTAYRPYWRRSVSQPFSDFGSTVGDDAGMKVFHELEPGLRALVKSHEPRFVSKIEARIKR